MAWPTDDISTSGVDQGTDTPPRAEFFKVFTRIKEIIAGRGAANGVCELDSNSKVPAARIPAPAAIASYVEGSVYYFHNNGGHDEQYNTLIDGPAPFVTETLGPTGSGANNTWLALDDLPANANAIYVSISSTCTLATNTASSYSLHAARGDGTLSLSTGESLVASINFQELAGARVRSLDAVWIPLDSEKRFKIQLNEYSLTGSASAIFTMKGFSVST